MEQRRFVVGVKYEDRLVAYRQPGQFIWLTAERGEAREFENQQQAEEAAEDVRKHFGHLFETEVLEAK